MVAFHPSFSLFLSISFALFLSIHLSLSLSSIRDVSINHARYSSGSVNCASDVTIVTKDRKE